MVDLRKFNNQEPGTQSNAFLLPTQITVWFLRKDFITFRIILITNECSVMFPKHSNTSTVQLLRYCYHRYYDLKGHSQVWDNFFATESALKMMKKIYNIKYAINTLPNVSRSKGSQTMKFGQLIEYNTRNFFIQKSCTKLFPDSFFKNRTWANRWIHSLKLYTVCFHFMPSWALLKLCRWPLAFTSYKTFSKHKKRSRSSTLGSFSA